MRRADYRPRDRTLADAVVSVPVYCVCGHEYGVHRFNDPSDILQSPGACTQCSDCALYRGRRVLVTPQELDDPYKNSFDCKHCGRYVTVGPQSDPELVRRFHEADCAGLKLELERRKVAALEFISRSLDSALQLGWHLYNEAHEPVDVTQRDAVQPSATPELERRCDCPTPGPMNGCACGAARSGRPFSAKHWCGCSCHLPVSTTSGGPTL